MTAPEVAHPVVGAEPEQIAYLYCLFSAARSGPLAGAFKLGIAGSFAARYHQHTRTWEERFDLSRSVLLQTNSRQEVLWLEKHLKRLCGEPGPDGRSWRRDPGRRADGHTEWLDQACLEPLLERAVSSMTLRGELGVRFRVVRGLSPADCALAGLAPDGTPLPPQPGSQAQRRALAQARQEQEQAIETARDMAVAGAALEVAQTYEEHLVWVNVDLWRWHQFRPTLRPTCFQTDWADLYFGRFGPPRSQPKVRSKKEPPPTPTQIRFEEACRRRLAAATDQTADPRLEPAWSCRLMDAVHSTATLFCYEDGSTEAVGPFPNSVCADALVLRLNFRRCESVQPYFARYEALAGRVESRHRWEQPYLL